MEFTSLLQIKSITMNILLLSIGLTIQSLWGNAYTLKSISQSKPFRNYSSSRSTSIDTNPGGGEIKVTGGLDISVDNGGSVFAQANNNSTYSVVRGLECGSTVQMHPGDSVQVFSTNFGVSNYYNNEACNWKFEANQCTLSAYCPCADIPRSWECLGDYLKIKTDYILENQRFCGGNKPGQPIYSDSDFLSVRFRSDGRLTAAGFTCVVRCEGPGMTIPIATNITCPISSSPQG